MPKRKSKGRRQKKRDEEPLRNGFHDGDELLADNASVTSSASDNKSTAADGEEELDETSALENFENKLKDLIDGLTQRSAKGRIECLNDLIMSLRKQYIYDFLLERKITLTDALGRCLRKGGPEERIGAAVSISLLLIQLGSNPESEALFKELRPFLNAIMADVSKTPKARASCAEALALGSFIASEELDDVKNVMTSLENVFKASYLKGDGSRPNHASDITALHTSAISAWTLLLSIAPRSVVQDFLDSHLSKIPELLSSSDVDLRITAGEAIALIYELAREDDEEFEGDDIAELCENLKQLATESNKFRAKKDRRQQHANFRDILKAVEDGEAPYYTVKFGMECLVIDSWTRKIQYDALCHMLGTGMNAHLQENEIVRDIFGLGTPNPISTQFISRETKAERRQLNAAAFKARTKVRAKHRDKRTIIINS